MKKNIVSLCGFISLLLLTACEEPQLYAGYTTEEEISKDLYECAIEISNLTHQAFNQARLEQLCMKSKGYKVYNEKDGVIDVEASEKEEASSAPQGQSETTENKD